MKAPNSPPGQGQLQDADQSIEGVVNGHHASKIFEAKQGSKDGKVGAVEEEAAGRPDNEGECLQWMWASVTNFLCPQQSARTPRALRVGRWLQKT